MITKLATFKNKNLNIKFKPKYIFSSCDALDVGIKKMVEDAFDASVIDCYGATETGPIAFHCFNGDHYHVDSNLLFSPFCFFHQVLR